jgi:hypothetical protein
LEELISEQEKRGKISSDVADIVTTNLREKKLSRISSNCKIRSIFIQITKSRRVD